MEALQYIVDHSGVSSQITVWRLLRRHLENGHGQWVNVTLFGVRRPPFIFGIHRGSTAVLGGYKDLRRIPANCTQRIVGRDLSWEDEQTQALVHNERYALIIDQNVCLGTKVVNKCQFRWMNYELTARISAWMNPFEWMWAMPLDTCANLRETDQFMLRKWTFKSDSPSRVCLHAGFLGNSILNR